MQSMDQRCYPRIEARGAIQAWVFLDAGDIARCRVLDFSRSGVLLEYPQLLLPGMKFQIAFAFKRGEKVTRLVRRWSRVTRHSPQGFAAVFIKRPRSAIEVLNGVRR